MRHFFTFAVLVGVLSTPSLAQEDKKAEEPLAQLAGVWKVASLGGHGKVIPAGGKAHGEGQELWHDTTFTIAGNQLTTVKEPVVLIPQTLDPKPSDENAILFAIYQNKTRYELKPVPAKEGPGAIDLVMPQRIVLKGIYELKDDELRLCVVNWLACQDRDGQTATQVAEGKPRPSDFTTKPRGDHVLFVLKRDKK